MTLSSTSLAYQLAYPLATHPFVDNPLTGFRRQPQPLSPVLTHLSHHVHHFLMFERFPVTDRRVLHWLAAHAHKGMGREFTRRLDKFGGLTEQEVAYVRNRTPSPTPVTKRSIIWTRRAQEKLAQSRMRRRRLGRAMVKAAVKRYEMRKPERDARKAAREAKQAMTKAALVTMRYADMTSVHPRQDNTRFCDHCHHRVGLYPSGQRVLKAEPDTEVLCTHCAAASYLASKVPIEHRSAGTIEEIVRECGESGPKFDA